MPSNQPLYILHLSDLHFGPHSRFAGLNHEELGQRFHLAIEEEMRRRKAKGRVALVLTTGDIAEAARPSEYKSAAAFFVGMAKALGLPRRSFVFTPGNHDVSWARSHAAQLEQDDREFDDAELRRRMDLYKFENFEEFVSSFYGEERGDTVIPLARGAVVHNFEELSVSVASLNSCEVESHRPGDHKGVLSEQQAQAVMNLWRGVEYADWLKLVCIHHNPVATTPANVEDWKQYLKQKGELDADLIDRFAADISGLEGKENLQRLAEECEVQLVLHGHHHATEQQLWPWKVQKGSTIILSAGSGSLKPDKLPGDEPNTVQLLRLDPARAELQPYILRYEPRARAQGVVPLGRFAPDPAVYEKFRLSLSLPAGFRAKLRGGLSRKSPRDATDFLRAYRHGLSGFQSRWDLSPVGVTQEGGANKPVDVLLDDMYVPLRLGENTDIREHDRGAVLLPADLLGREKPLVIRGHAGTGKTTWMRWTFRQFLNNEGALPMMVELRRLALEWQGQKKGDGRSLYTYLENWAAEYVGAGWKGWLTTDIIKRQTGPRPILFVDGWDELGELGEEVRGKLMGFMKSHPRLLVVVSSRPYGQGRPSHSEGFDVLDIQPLSDAEIETLSRHFFFKCYAEEGSTVEAAHARFMNALWRSTDATSLARTAMLLTMMLLISRSRPLPDKRHQLFQACIENLLTALPDMRQEQGAQLLREQWRPPDSEERLREIAQMAHKMQVAGFRGPDRVPIVLMWEQMASLLPAGWKPEQRRGFLAWLAGPAGLLVDKADGTVSFSHLSFQEYLVAWHLHATVEGDETRVELCRERMQQVSWWETLRLWAARVEGMNPLQLEPVLKALMGDEETGLWFTGTVFADGLGSDAEFDRWLSLFYRPLLGRWPASAEFCAGAWAASRQDARREAIAERMREEAAACTWLQWSRLRYWAELANLPADSILPRRGSNARFVAEASQGETPEERHIAVGRILSHGFPLWPTTSSELVLLQTWPSRRKDIGSRLQALASFPVGLERVMNHARELVAASLQPANGDGLSSMLHVLHRRLSDAETSADVLNLYDDLISDMNRAFGLEALPKDFRSWLSHVRDYCSYTLKWSELAAKNSGVAFNFATFWMRYATRPEEQSYFRARLLSLPPDLELGDTDVHAIGLLNPRSLIARLKPASPLMSIFSHACRLSLDPEAEPDALLAALELYAQDSDPLWTALARHLARLSTEQDKALLEELAQHPERRDPPVSWGLRYIVRGDVILDDGDVLTLDEVTDRMAVPRLSYLEDIPSRSGVNLSSE